VKLMSLFVALYMISVVVGLVWFVVFALALMGATHFVLPLKIMIGASLLTFASKIGAAWTRKAALRHG